MSKYKYRNHENRARKTEIYGHFVAGRYFILRNDGLLTVRKDYLWNGSDWSFDWKSREASMFHDCLYQLMREGFIGQEHRMYSDGFYREILIENGLWKWHANFRYSVLRKIGGISAKLTKKPEHIILSE